MRVRDQVKDCVVSLGRGFTADDGREAMKPAGTGFLVLVPHDDRANGNPFPYLVTAKHVASTIELSQLVIRVNLKGQGRGATFLRFEEGISGWWYHPEDEAVDVAVLPFNVPGNLIDQGGIPVSLFATDALIKERDIGIGDEVFVIGLFVHLAGTSRNHPILRIGNIAMMPDEKVATSQGNADAYLIEARSLGGISGSPVFVRTVASDGSKSSLLLGLIHGHWDVPIIGEDDAVTHDTPEWFGSVNLGIAVVVPAVKILETLYQQQLIELRRSGRADPKA